MNRFKHKEGTLHEVPEDPTAIPRRNVPSIRRGKPGLSLDLSKFGHRCCHGDGCERRLRERFLEVPMKIASDWIERVVHGSSKEFDGKGGDHQNRVILELKTFYGV